MNSRNLLLNAYVYLVLCFLVVPILIILPMAFSETDYITFPPRGFTWQWFGAFFQSAQWMSATAFSAKIAFFTAISSAIIGLCASYAIVRGKGALATIFQTLLIGPIVVPHIALAIALYLMFQSVGLTETTAGYVFAHTIIALPFSVFTIVATLSQVDPALEDAAMCCGANRFLAFRAVTLPLIWPNVLSGALFAFVISFDEPVISFFLAGVRDKTLPRMMFDDIEQNLTPIIPAIAVMLTLLSIIVLVGAAGLRALATRSQQAVSEE